MTEYWFARYRPAANPRSAGRGLIALNWKGRAVIALFVLCLVLGGSGMLYFGLHNEFMIGIPLFVVLVIIGAATFIWASVSKTDPTKSAWDYLKERQT
jgi:hypothetical protein